MPRRPQPVFFVYTRSSLRLGSTQMRCVQLCQIMRRHGSGAFDYHEMRVPNFAVAGLAALWAATRPRDAAYIFVKDAIDRLPPSALSLLHRRAGAVLHDPIDRPIRTTPMAHVDLHVASSLTQERALRVHLGGTAATGLLLHQPDLRLPENPALPTDLLHPAYFGDPVNAVLTDAIAQRVAVIDVGLASGMEAGLARFAQANLHYAVRPADQIIDGDVIKPLTKAVMAARCGAPIMVNRAAPDAEALLGADFPYLVDTTDPAQILAMLDRAAYDFGGPNWKEATERMRALASRVHPAQTAKDLEHLLEAAL